MTRYLGIAMVVAFTALAGCDGVPAPAATPAGGGRIVFVSDRNQKREIYTMNADGSEPTSLTNNPAQDRGPSWSPDGKQVAFSSDRDASVCNCYEIYVMNADGSGQTRLTNNEVDDSGPSWALDGRRIVFQAEDSGNYALYLMDVDGSSQDRLTHDPELLSQFVVWHTIGYDREAGWWP